MARHGHLAETALIGFGAAALLSFRPVRVIVLLAFSVLSLMYVWDKVITERDLTANEYHFQAYDYQDRRTDPAPLGENGGWNPQFSVTWKIKNKSTVFMQTFRLHYDLYLCEDPNYPTDTCDIVKREAKIVAANLPAGMTYSTKDVLSFTRGTALPGYLRANVWISDVRGDNDRDE